MKEDTPFDEYRTGYISERFDLPKNAARALQLFELGYTVSGAAKALPVTEGTVKSYHSQIQEKIHPNAVMPLAGKGRDGSLDVWGDRHISEVGSSSFKDGQRDARRTSYESTKGKGFRDLPLNRGTPRHEIPKKLIG